MQDVGAIKDPPPRARHVRRMQWSPDTRTEDVSVGGLIWPRLRTLETFLRLYAPMLPEEFNRVAR